MTIDIFHSKRPPVDPTLTARVTAVESEVTTARGGQANLNARLGSTDSTISGISSGLNAVTSEVTTARGGQANLDARLDANDTAVSNVTTEVANARHPYANLEERLDAEYALFNATRLEVNEAHGVDLPDLKAKLDQMQEEAGFLSGILAPPAMSIGLAPLDVNGDLIPLSNFIELSEYATTTIWNTPYTPGDGVLWILNPENGFWDTPTSVNGHYWLALGTGDNMRVIKPAGTPTNLFWVNPEDVTVANTPSNYLEFTEAIIDATNPAPGSGGVWPVGTPVTICGPVARPYIAISGRRLIKRDHWNESTALVQGTTVDKAVVDADLLPAGTDALGLVVVINW
jgi:hypothetical protein